MRDSNQTCQSCHTPLLPGALYCHNCGKQVDGEGVVCFACKMVNPAAARFCSRCGTPLNVHYTPNPNVTPLYGLDFGDLPTLPTQLLEAFKAFVSHSLEQEGAQDKERHILTVLDNSPFKQRHLEEAVIYMTQSFERAFETGGTAAFAAIEQEVDRQFVPLLERLYIEFCAKLLPRPLPTAILHHQVATLHAAKLQRLILDYLDLDQEPLLLYTSAIEIPLKKLKNARSTFFGAKEGEVPFLFIDQTLLRSGKEGCILTAQALYWKAYFQRPARVGYRAIEQLEYKGDHLMINQRYFHVNDDFDYKLYRLLVRLKTLSS